MPDLHHPYRDVPPRQAHARQPDISPVLSVLLRYRRIDSASPPAQRLLTTTNHRVIDIAMECGFGSAARFYSAFSRYCNTKPLDYHRNNKVDT